MPSNRYYLQALISCFAFHFVVTGVCAEECDWIPFPLSGEATIAYDHFYGLPDGSWNGHTGAYFSLNLATPLPYLSDQGFGTQLGGSYGVYDWSGRVSTIKHRNEVQQQTFLTVGIFRITPDCSGINFGLVYDWMTDKNLGVFALNPNLDQVM